MEFDTYLRFLMALIFVLALIGLLAWLAKRFGVGGKLSVTPGRRRLGIVEVSQLDGKRRLVLVRRDSVEHLLLLGTGSETVVERGIPIPEGAEAHPDGADAEAAEPAIKRLAAGVARARAAGRSVRSKARAKA